MVKLLDPKCSQEEALRHRKARYISPGVYGMWGRTGKDYRIIVFPDGLKTELDSLMKMMLCTCNAEIDWKKFRASGEIVMDAKVTCWHKMGVAIRLVGHPAELLAALQLKQMFDELKRR